MGMAAFRKLVSCVLLLIVPGSLIAADSGAAMLYADGAAWLNGSHVPKSSAIFAGDLVQTRSDSAANIHAPGSSVTVLGDSLVQFEGASLKVEHGGVSCYHIQGRGHHGWRCAGGAGFQCVDRIQCDRHRWHGANCRPQGRPDHHRRSTAR